MAMMVTGIVVELEDKTDKSLKKLNSNLTKLGLKAKKTGRDAGKGLRNPIVSAFKSISKFARDTFFLMETFGRVGRMAFRGMVNPIVSATKASLGFEKKMAEVMTLLQGVEGAPQMEELKSQVLDLSREFGQMPEDQVKALYQIISAGALEGANALGTLRAANMLAVGGLTDTASAASAIATVINAFSLGFENAEHVANLFFKTVQKGVTTVPQLTQKIGMVAGTAGSAGMSLESLFASIAVGTKAIGNTAFTITGLNMAITALRAPGKTAQEEFERLGIEFGDTAVTGENFIKTMTELAKRNDLSATSLKKMFPQVRALRFIFAATNDTATDFNEQLANTKDVTGDLYDQFAQSQGAANLLNRTLIDFKKNADAAAKSAFSVVEATAGFQLDRLTASFETVKILFGDLFVSSSRLGSVFKGMSEGLALVAESVERVVLQEDNTSATADNLEKLGRGLVLFATDAALSAITVVSQLVKVLSRLNVVMSVAAKFVPDEIILGDAAKTLPKQLSDFTAAVQEAGVLQMTHIPKEALLDVYNDKVRLSEVLTKVYVERLKTSQENLKKAQEASAKLAAQQQELNEKHAAGERIENGYANSTLSLNNALRQQMKREEEASSAVTRRSAQVRLLQQRLNDLRNIEEMRTSGVYKALRADEETAKVVADLNVKILRLRTELAKDPGDTAKAKQLADLMEKAAKQREKALKDAEEAARRKQASEEAQKKKEQERNEAAKEAFIRRIAEQTTAEIAHFDTLAAENSDYLRGTETREMAYRDFKVKILEDLSKKEKALAKQGFQLGEKLDRQALRLKKQRAKEELEAAKSALFGGMDIGPDQYGTKPLSLSESLGAPEIKKAQELMTAQLIMIDNLASYANLSDEKRGEMRLRSEKEILAQAHELNKAFYTRGIALAKSAYKTIAERAKEAYQGDISAQTAAVAAASKLYSARLAIASRGVVDEIGLDFAKDKAKRETLAKFEDYEQEAARRGVSVINDALGAQKQASKDSLRDIEQFAESAAGTIVDLGSSFITDLLDKETTAEQAFKNLGMSILDMIARSLAEFIIAETIKTALVGTTAASAVKADGTRLASGLATDLALIQSSQALAGARTAANLAGGGMGMLGALGLGLLGVGLVGALFASGKAGFMGPGESERMAEDNRRRFDEFAQGLGVGAAERHRKRLGDAAAESRKKALGYAKGGLVTGGISGRDSVPAMLTPGEFVLSRDIVDSIKRGLPSNNTPLVAPNTEPPVVFAPVIQTVALPNSAQNQRYYRDTVKRTQARLAANGYT